MIPSIGDAEAVNAMYPPVNDPLADQQQGDNNPYPPDLDAALGELPAQVGGPTIPGNPFGPPANVGGL